MSTMRECLELILLAREAECIVLDGLDDAIVGFDTENEVAIYDYHKIIECYVAMGMSHDEAVEFYEFNLARGLPYMGDKRPIISVQFDGPDWDT